MGEKKKKKGQSANLIWITELIKHIVAFTQQTGDFGIPYNSASPTPTIVSQQRCCYLFLFLITLRMGPVINTGNLVACLVKRSKSSNRRWPSLLWTT